MTVYIFETAEYGKVEINTDIFEAYFFGRDEIYALDGHTGEFQDFDGTRFTFSALISGIKNQDAVLQVWVLKEIGRDTRASR